MAILHPGFLMYPVPRQWGSLAPDAGLAEAIVYRAASLAVFECMRSFVESGRSAASGAGSLPRSGEP